MSEENGGFSLSRLADKKPNVREAWQVILLVTGLIIVGWFKINTVLWDVASTWWFLGLTATIGIVAAIVISHFTPINFGVPISEASAFPVKKRWLALVAIIMGLLTFFFISQTPYHVQMPTFQIIDPGIAGVAMLDIFAAIFEDCLFFILIPGILFTFAYYGSSLFTKNSDDNSKIKGIIALIVVLIVAPLIFTVYHIGTYGFEDIPATTAVFFFGLEMTAWMLLMRDSFYVHARHIGNNTGILVFSAMSLETFMITLLSNWVVWLILFVVGVGIFFRIIRRK